MKISLPKPVNDTQTEFKRVCEIGGGTAGGPVRNSVLELLRAGGKRLNTLAFRDMADQMAACPGANPWYVCFGFGLVWGHLAKQDIVFTQAVVGVLTDWNSNDLAVARSFHLERGPAPIEQSLLGARQLFARVVLPDELPTTLDGVGRAQERWLSPIIGPNRPRYIGSWNATAMFMAALFAQPTLARTQLEPRPILPPGGPIYEGLRILHRGGVISRRPAGSDLDDEAFEPGALYENNALLAELRTGLSNWSLTDVHSGVYMLGTRHPHSGIWS